ncbi:MAG: type II secretion system protein GspF [Gammaproteobacteria bacterium]|nr:MAG: type II secretion system protein GspF [Gammaproteobacteria bacterium]
MASFEYIALDSITGEQSNGMMEGDSEKSIRSQLRGLNLTPIEIKTCKDSGKIDGKFKISNKKLSASDISIVTRQFSTLIQSGTPIEEALSAIAQHSEKKTITTILMGVRAGVLEGMTLSKAMSYYPKTFDELFRATVEAGESSGHLDAVLNELADYTESSYENKQKIKTALFYPITLIVLSIIIVAGLLTFVVPQVVQVFDDSKESLPTLTIVILGISDFLLEFGLEITATIIVFVITFKQLLKIRSFQYSIHIFLLKLPILGKLIRGQNTATFTQTLSILASSGVPVLEALNIGSKVIMNLPMKEAVEQTAIAVREGASLYKSLEKTKLFPPMTLHLISSGESSGELDTMLSKAANFQQREVSNTIAVILSMFEPLIILVMGVLVLLIVLAILLPIFELNQLIG